MRQPGGSGKDSQHLRRAPMTDICRYAHEGMEPQFRLNSDPPLLQPPEGDDLLLQDDNSRSQRARIVDDYLHKETIQRMEWSARLPDLNPNEHV
ncbi:hypothetical protein AVEN_262785-1 [Araneus ventricosus]|uniref:Uncharacterized protein n=1 Tax=Araneus ventricosus TaxID=182803 RepID=A0A4Y2LCF2_ARAVE|nr:hypothetical protein AVEN_262785-1 [Araneus ventricosus]